MTEYRRYQGKSYMILKDHVKTGGFEYRILLKQTIRGLLPFQIAEDNGQKQFWYEISGKAKLHSIVLPAALSSKPEYKKLGKYVYGEVELEEGTRLNAVVRGKKATDQA